MKTVIFIQVLYIFINLEGGRDIFVNGSGKCESSIETRAVLISCPEKDTGCEDDDPLTKATQADEYRLFQVKPNEMKRLKAEIEREFPNRVTDCKRKLVITMKLNNKGKIDSDDGFIVIDHVYDPITRGKARLLSPVIIKLRQEQMVQLYPLQFQKVVNSDPNEKIFTKEVCSSFKGCSDNYLDNPTCGITTYDGEPIPFSEGFCCSGDQYGDSVPDVPPDKHEYANRYKDPSLFGFQKNRAARSRMKSSVIVNPNLVHLRANSRQKMRYAADDDYGSDSNMRGERHSCPPNFFFERDRQIVLAPEALVKELCNVDNREDCRKTGDECQEDDQDNQCNSNSDIQYKHISVKIDPSYNCSQPKPNIGTQGDECEPEGESCDECESNSNSEEKTTTTTNCPPAQAENSNSEEEDTFSMFDMNDYALDANYELIGNRFDENEPLDEDLVPEKREAMSVTRRRQKRTVREDYDFYQYSRDKRKKHILSIVDRKSSGRKVSRDVPDMGGDPGAAIAPPNCTLPVFFFTNDKKIICMPKCISEQEQPDSLDYEESTLNSEVEKKSENVDDSPGNEKVASDNIGEDMTVSETPPIDSVENERVEELPQLNQLPLNSKVVQLHTSKGGIWDVNANVRNGNLFRLDLVKTEPDKIDPSERIEEINYEQKYFGGNQKVKDKPSGQRLGGSERYRFGNARSDLSEARMYNRGKDSDPFGYSKRKVLTKGREFVGRTGGMDFLERPGTMEFIIPDKNNNYKKINVDIRPSDIELLRKGSRGTLKRPESPDDLRGQQWYRERIPQMRKENGVNSDLNIQQFYNPDPAWKKSYYRPIGWNERVNPRHNYQSKRESIIDLLSHNHPHHEEANNDYLVSNKNVLFANTKARRSMRKILDPLKPENVGVYDRRRSGSNIPEFPPPADFDYKEHHKLRNTHFVRSKRSLSDAPILERPAIISKWEHRAPPGPEYQFDVSTLNRPRKWMSGGEDEQRYGGLQNNFMKFKKSRGKESEKAKRELKLKMDQDRLMRSYRSSPKKYKREVQTNGRVCARRHVRDGLGQDDYDGSTEVSVDEGSSTSEKGSDGCHESAHCVKFSDLWYSVYLIRRPELSQLVGIQVYDKQTMCDGTTNWRDLTKGYMIRLGSFLQRAEDDVPTISMTFTPTGPNVAKDEPKLDTENYRLLIPTHLTNSHKANQYPEFDGGPSEYMLVPKDDISETGADCNMVGTSFEAFVKQPDRCSQPPGSCVKRKQPIDLWREDMEARIRKKRGKYFIENFGSVSNTSIKSYTNLTGDFLAMDYYGEYSSVVEIEMRADGNAVVRQGENAQIPSVYIDGMASRKVKIVLSVMNMGLTSSLFRPRLGECPSNLDPTWCPLEGPLVLIPPQQRHDFKLELSGVLPAKKVHCAVEVLNQFNKKVTRRRIIIKKADRCFCAFYCKCVCINGAKRVPCEQLSREDYNAAGYFDPIPQRNSPSGNGSDAFWQNCKIVLVCMAYTLFALGIAKAVFGLFWRRLGTAGIPVIVGPRTLCQYYESDICEYEVVYNECGFPIHPQTYKSVQIVPLWIEVFLNFFFFYLYFLRILWLLLSSVPCCKLVCIELDCCQVEDSDDEVSMCKSRTTRNVSTNYFNYNVMTFTSKKPKVPAEKVSYHTYNEDPLEKDDTEFVLGEIKRYKNKNAND